MQAQTSPSTQSRMLCDVFACSADVRQMEAILALEDGTWFKGRRRRRGGRSARRGRVQHQHDRLPGGADRPLVPGPDRHDDVSGDRQLRRDAETSSRARPQVAGFIVREHRRREQLALGRHAARVSRRHRSSRSRHRHAGADADASVERRHARRHRDRYALDPEALVERARAMPTMEGSDLVRDVTCQEPFDWHRQEDRRRVRHRRAPAAREAPPADRGVRLRHEVEHPAASARARLRGARLSRHAPAAELLATQPDGVFLSNGPGDPGALDYAIDNARTLVAAKVPIFGICLGHQILGLAMGGETFKLKFGHRGANQPVKKLDQARWRSRRRITASRSIRRRCRRTSSDAPQPERQHGRGPPAREQAVSACSIIPRRRRARTTPTTCSRFSE